MSEWRHYSPKVSVVVVTFNGRRFLFDCLTSIKETKYPAFETILVDNGSRDGSSQYVKDNFPWVKVCYLDSNKGYTGGNNIGAKIAQGEFVVFLNNDVVVDPMWISELVKVAEGDSNIAAVCGYDIPMRFLGSKIDISRVVQTKESAIAGGCIWLVRKSVWNAIGPLREEFFCTWEEYEWSWRAFLRGYTIYSTPHSFVFHHGSGTSGIAKLLSSQVKEDWDNPYFYYFYRNEFLFYWYTLRLPYLVWPVLKWLLKFALNGIFRWNQYALRHMWKAWLYIFSNKCKLWRERKRALRSWILPDRKLWGLWREQRKDWECLNRYYKAHEQKRNKSV
ncbi:MAG: glycosyltransferase family 2 protein [Planctomycetota bacterium]